MIAGWKNIFRALKYRNYRLFFAGQGISLIGTWMQQVAMSWYVYRSTNSSFLLGLVIFLNQVPSLLFSPIAGVFADRFNRKNALVFTQAMSMLQAFALSILVLTDTAGIASILCLSFFLGMINSLDAPLRQSFIIDLVEGKENLGNAIALNSAMFNSARLIGPSIAGMMISIAGEGACFLINAASYTAVICALLAMKIQPSSHKPKKDRVWKHLSEGLKYSFGFMPIRYILMMMGLFSFMGMSYIVIMPVFARDVLSGGAHTLGFLMGAAGFGALIGALYLASKKSIRGLTKHIPVMALLFSACIIAFSLSKILVLSLAILVVTGFGMIMFMGSCNTILQNIVEEDKRGRVMSLYTMAFMGLTPFGSLLVGSLSGKIGAPMTLRISGIACALGGIIFLIRLPVFREKIRPIYEKMGVLEPRKPGIAKKTIAIQELEDK